MCFGGNEYGAGGSRIDTTIRDQQAAEAAEARAREEARQQRIKDGTTAIDSAFAGFNDDFFNQRKQAFMGYYQPQVDKAYSDAQKQLTYALARAGTLNSSMAGEKGAQLNSKYQDEVASILSRANADTSDFRARVAGEKSSLLQQLNASGDATAASNDALGRTQLMFQEQPQYNTLGDIFGGFASGIGSMIQSNRDRAVYDTYFGKSNKGAARVIN